MKIEINMRRQTRKKVQALSPLQAPIGIPNSYHYSYFFNMFFNPRF